MCSLDKFEEIELDCVNYNKIFSFYFIDKIKNATKELTKPGCIIESIIRLIVFEVCVGT